MSGTPARSRMVVVFILCLVVALAAYKFSMPSSDTAPESTPESTPESMPESASQKAAPKPEATAVGAIEIDLDAALADRAMGSPDAPVVVYEYSSLTCPHCAAFHEETLPQIKRDYIDTGKVRWVVKDFPLDGGAMQATLLLRCAPADAYFILAERLFATQKEWGLSRNLPVELAKIGMDAGLAPQRFEACRNNRELGDAIVSSMKKAAADWQIKATPSFIINDGAEHITGGRSYEDFAKILDAQLAE